MTEIVEMLAIIGTVTASLFGIFRFELRKLCKEVEGIKSDIKEIHDKVFH